MNDFNRTAITALLAVAIGAGLTVHSKAGPLPVNTAMKEAVGEGAIQARWGGWGHGGWGWGMGWSPGSGIIGGAMAAGAYGPYDYGYLAYNPGYSYLAYGPYYGGYHRLPHWGHRRYGHR